MTVWFVCWYAMLRPMRTPHEPFASPRRTIQKMFLPDQETTKNFWCKAKSTPQSTCQQQLATHVVFLYTANSLLPKKTLTPLIPLEKIELLPTVARDVVAVARRACHTEYSQLRVTTYVLPQPQERAAHLVAVVKLAFGQTLLLVAASHLNTCGEPLCWLLSSIVFETIEANRDSTMPSFPRCQHNKNDVEELFSANKNNKMMSEMMRNEIKWKEKSERSETTLTMRMKHENDYGWTETQTWATMGAHLNKEDIQKNMTLTGNKEERDWLRKTKDLQCMMAHALASTTLTDFPNVSNHLSHCWDFHSALRVNNSVVVAVPIYSISDLYANSL